MLSRMFKATILGHNPVKEKLISDLHKAGILEIVEIEKEAEKEAGFNDSDTLQAKLQRISKLIEDLNYSANFLNPFKPKKAKKTRSYTDENYQTITRSFKYNILEKIKKFNQQMQQHENRIDYCYNMISLLSPWQKVKVEFDQMNFEHVNTFFGIMNKKKLSSFQKEIERVNLSSFNIIHSTRDNVYFFLMYAKQIEETINEMMKAFPLTAMDFSFVRGTIYKTMTSFKDEIKDLETHIEDIKEQLKEYAEYFDDILICVDYWGMVFQREEIKRKFYATQSTFLLKGWIQEKDIDRLKGLNKKYRETDISFSLPEPGEVPPVALKNNPVFSPFEMVTKLFGVPGTDDVDPTPLLAPFFALFFGICLTDAGYGLVLLILSALLLFKLRKTKGEGTVKLMKVLIISGLFTIIVGAITGGWFGIDFDKLPKAFRAIKEFRDRLVLLEPLKNPLVLFITTLALGAVQVLTGIIIKLFLYVKDKRYYEAFSSPFAWFLIVSGIISAMLLKIKLLWVFPVAGACIILVFTSRQGNILVRLLKGAYSLYGITSIFGDILSYSRLFALALSTGVIALVINVVVGILYQMIVKIPYVGVPMAVIFGIFIVVFGHLFNIVINSLGGFIHTTRLQFVEYFGKFYEGSGSEFRPFKREYKYIKIQ